MTHSLLVSAAVLRCVTIVMVLTACGASAPVPPPQTAVERYLKAIEAQDSAGMYALLSPERRQGVGAEQFQQRVADTRTELTESAQRIRDTGTPAEASAVVTLEDGETVQLVLENGQWRIAAGLLDAASLRTPNDAVQTLHRVLVRRDLAGLLALLTREERTSWEAAFGRMIESTADPLDWETEVRGDEATVRTTGGGVILLHRESGRWRVQDIREPAP